MTNKTTTRPKPDFPEPGPPNPDTPATILALANQKGGVGKTTTTISLGAALVETGRKVLLVDLDPQGSMTVGLGFNGPELETTVYDALIDTGVSAADVILQTKTKGLDLLPSNIDLAAAEMQLVNEVGREQTLARVLNPAREKYDIILIDCPPSLGLLTINALTAADGVIIPLETEYFALRGVALLKETIDRVRERINPRLAIIGLLGTMFDSRTLHAREVMASLIEGWGDLVFHTAIHRTIKFSDATVSGEPITSFAADSAGAQEYRDLAKEVLARCPGA